MRRSELRRAAWILAFAVVWMIGAGTATYVIERATRGDNQAQAAGLRSSLNTPVVDGNVRPVVGGYQRITDLSSAVTPAQQAGADVMVIQAEGQTLRYTTDGTTTPTATIGFPLPAGDRLVYPGDLSTIQLIQTASGGIAHVQPYRY